MKVNLVTAICLSLGMFLFSSCKKDTKENDTPPLSASALSSGRAGIHFTTTEDFKGSTSFILSNTDNTSAIAYPPIGNTTIKTIFLEAIEMKDNSQSRKASIVISLPDTANTASGSIQIDLSAQSGVPPPAGIHLESYAPLSGSSNWTITPGTLTITKLTATEIEGTFFGTAVSNSPSGDPLTINNGVFAGKF